MTGAGRLESLLRLQDRDGTLDRLQHRRDTLAERVTLTEVEAALAQLESRHRALAGRRDELSRQEQRLGDEAGALREKAAEVEAKMYSGSVSSPRELQAMQADVEQLRRHERAVEVRELEVMEALEPVERDLDTLEGERSKLDARLSDTRSSLERSEADIDREMSEERKVRDAIAGDIDQALVTEYERRRARAQGVGVARLAGSTCQGCHLSIPSTEVDQIRKAPEGSLQFCDNCGCILVP